MVQRLNGYGSIQLGLRYSPFDNESFRVLLWGKKVTCSISRNGDLIHRMYLRVTLPAVTVGANKAFRWLNWLGHILVKNVEIK